MMPSARLEDPGRFFPTEKEFNQAVQDAEGILAFVLSLLPQEVHPNKQS
jgi:hypothetical protein